MKRLALLLYRLALLAFPSRHRAVYMREMMETFELSLKSRSNPGFVVAACVDAIRAGLGERRRYQSLRPIAFVGRDLVHAVHALAKAPTFCLVSVLSVGIGIGTVILSVVAMRSITSTPPGVVEDGSIELLVHTNGSASETWTYPDYIEIRDANPGMSIAGWAAGESVVRLSGDVTVSLDAAYVSPDYFKALGIRLARGSTFGSGPEVILRYDVWQDRFGGDPQIVGSTIVVNGVPHVVAAITPQHFRGHLVHQTHTMDRGGTGFEFWLPLLEHPHRDGNWLRLVGRLAPGMTLAQANGAINALKRASVEPYFAAGALQRWDVYLEKAAAIVVTGMVLLVVCLNVSGMVLVRTATRERELAVRLAVGASRARLVQYLLAESVVIATLGGALGALVIFGTPAAAAWWFDEPVDIAFRTDTTIVATTAALCFVTSLVFGMLPAVRFSRPRIISALKDDAGGGRRVGRIHRATAAIQAGFAVPFLVVCVVMIDQVRVTASMDIGFKPEGLFYVPLNPGDRAHLLENAQNTLARAAGVSSVTVADGFPLDSNYRLTGVRRAGANEVVRAQPTRISPHFLETFGVPILRGRDISADDKAGSENVAVISQPLAARLFADADPLGQRLELALDGGKAHSYTVVGISGDVIASHLSGPQPQVFVALAQHSISRVFIVARSPAASAAMGPVFENALADFNLAPGVVRSGLDTIDHHLRSQRTELIMGAVATGGTAVVALLLAALGVFGVIGFMVATRTREIGIRIALGASRPRVLREVLLDSLKLAIPGVTGGLLLAVPFVNEVSWYSLGVVEPFAYLAATSIALGIALLAGLPAARRAAAVEPMVAMRSE